MSKLDKALSGGPTGNAAGKPGTAAGRSAAGSTVTGGTGGGTGAGTGGGGASGGGQGYSVSWEGAGSGTGRTLVSSVFPKIPSWVSAQGLTLSVVVSFTVLADGIVSGAAIQQSSGDADVDASVVDAIRRVSFFARRGRASRPGSHSVRHPGAMSPDRAFRSSLSR